MTATWGPGCGRQVRSPQAKGTAGGWRPRWRATGYAPFEDGPPVHAPVVASHPWLDVQHEQAPADEQQTNELA
jgi:hypothetical protein